MIGYLMGVTVCYCVYKIIKKQTKKMNEIKYEVQRTLRVIEQRNKNLIKKKD